MPHFRSYCGLSSGKPVGPFLGKGPTFFARFCRLLPAFRAQWFYDSILGATALLREDVAKGLSGEKEPLTRLL
jgi:hypothetical protein